MTRLRSSWRSSLDQSLHGFMNLTTVPKDSWHKLKVVFTRYSMILSQLPLPSNIEGTICGVVACSGLTINCSDSFKGQDIAHFECRSLQVASVLIFFRNALEIIDCKIAVLFWTKNKKFKSKKSRHSFINSSFVNKLRNFCKKIPKFRQKYRGLSKN